jgi:hypothetical protein
MTTAQYRPIQLAALVAAYRIAMAGHKNDWNVNVRFGELELKVQATQSRQPDVEDQTACNIRKLAPQQFGGGPNTSTRKLTDWKRLVSALRIDSSSSMTKTIGCSALVRSSGDVGRPVTARSLDAEAG